jgi:hypothetical protein
MRDISRGKPKIMLSVEGSSDMPALIFETRGCGAVCPFFPKSRASLPLGSTLLLALLKSA